MTSFTEAASMPRSRKSRDAAATARRRVRAASSRDRRIRTSGEIEPELLSNRAVEDARRNVPSQPREKTGALAGGISQARPFRRGCLDHDGGDRGWIVASAHAGANDLADAFAGNPVVVHSPCGGGAVAVEPGARPTRLDERDADAQRAGFVIE